MKKFFLFLLILPFGILAQESSRFVSTGILRSSLTFSSGIMSFNSTTPVYLHGMLEYYTSPEVSIKSDVFYFIKNNELNLNHQAFTGAAYHFETRGNFDPYIGFQPGISITELKVNSDIVCVTTPCPGERKTAVNPVIAVPFGFNLYFPKWFHLFAEGRYVTGRHATDDGFPVSLSELRFSFGLGWNFDLVKNK